MFAIRKVRNFDVFGPPNSLGGGTPKCLTHMLGADPSPVRCALASAGHPLPTVKFVGAKPLSP